MTTSARPERRPRTATHPTKGHPADPLAAREMHFDLLAEASRLRGEQAYARSGRNAITLFKYPDLRVVLTALRAGTRIAGHRTDGRLAVQVLSGCVRLHVAGKAAELPDGALLALDCGVEHDLEAISDTVFLLTVSPSRK